MPEDMIPKIATEKDVETIDQLKTWLKEKGHPIVNRWKEEPAAEAAPAAAPQQQMTYQQQAMPTMFTMPTMELPAGAVPGLPSGMKIRIILKNAKIKAERVIIKAEKE